jgi:hypothetical protein
MKHRILDQQEKDYSKSIQKAATHFHLEMIPKDLLKVILSFCNIVEYHILRFVCKDMHNQIHNYKEKEKKGYNISFLKGNAPDLVSIGILAIKEGYLNILIWIKELFPIVFSARLNYSIYSNCPTSIRHFRVLSKLAGDLFFLIIHTCSLAASFGRLEILKWARKKLLFWDE